MTSLAHRGICENTSAGGKSESISDAKKEIDMTKSRTALVGLSVAFLCAATALAQSRYPHKATAASPLRLVADVPMPGAAVRFDYQSFDPTSDRLYIAHMNADQLVVFDTASRTVVANLDGFKRVHGVIAVPEIDRVYASATGDRQVVAVDAKSLAILARVGPVTYPDGLAYAPEAGRVFVSDEHGNADAVVDARSNSLVTSIALGGGAGNTVYDPGSKTILVAVHETNELVSIDPIAAKIVAQYPVPGVREPHGVCLDSAHRMAFVAGQANHTLGVFDLTSKKILETHSVGEDPDVLAFDPELGLLYVSAESGTVSVFREWGRKLVSEGKLTMPHAHTVCVDPKTHLVYFPLENVSGHPILRIMEPARK
jgi:DNA-binding beta-propeller fold protein YncE